MPTIKLQLSKEEMEEYRDFFRYMRKSIGYTQDGMAKEIGVNTSTLSRWERGVRIPKENIDEIERKYRDTVKRVRKQLVNN